MQSHYLNTSGQDITAKVRITFHLAKSGTISAHAGVLFVVEPKILVPPQQTAVVKHDCNLPFDMNLVKVSSHMHKHGTNFVSTIAGRTCSTRPTGMSREPALFNPARAVKAAIRSRSRARSSTTPPRRHVRRVGQHQRDVHLRGDLLPGAERRRRYQSVASDGGAESSGTDGAGDSAPDSLLLRRWREVTMIEAYRPGPMDEDS